MAGTNRLNWNDALSADDLCLYAGDLYDYLPQYPTHIGLTPFDDGSPRTIRHDVCDPMPIPDGCVRIYQSEDVFEHLPYDTLPTVLDEIHRVLKPGGLFRLSLPDYRFDHYAQRCVRDADGRILFDPDGGGRFVDGRVIDGGHVWFPIIEPVEALFRMSPFASGCRIEYLHYTDCDGRSVTREIDYSLGFISRTPDHDERGAHPRRAVSIVVDAWKS